MDIFRYAAGGFRDFSRIAASHPVMWHDIFIANKSALLNSLDEFQQHLNEFKEIIETQNSEKLLDWLATSRHARRHFGHMLAKKSTHKPEQRPASRMPVLADTHYLGITGPGFQIRLIPAP